MQLNLSFELSRERLATYCHYFILFFSPIIVVFIVDSKFFSSSENTPKKYILLENDTTLVNDEMSVSDSLIHDMEEVGAALPDSGWQVSGDSSVFKNEEDSIIADNIHIIEERKNINGKELKKVKDINEEAQTWFRLIIDFLETISPLVGPIVSYYFVRRERKKSDQIS